MEKVLKKYGIAEATSFLSGVVTEGAQPLHGNNIPPLPGEGAGGEGNPNIYIKE